MNPTTQKARHTPASFRVPKAAATLIQRIVARARREYRALGFDVPDPLTLSMDLTATHANGCPMDFAAMLDGERGDFLHDVSGIQRHINRRTGTLENCFFPRFAARPRFNAKARAVLAKVSNGA